MNSAEQHLVCDSDLRTISPEDVQATTIPQIVYLHSDCVQISYHNDGRKLDINDIIVSPFGFNNDVIFFWKQAQ